MRSEHSEAVRCVARRERVIRCSVGLVGMALSLSLSAAMAGDGTPRQPLLPPFYSFDRDSPSVQAGIVPADAVLRFDGERAVVVVSPAELNLGRPLDDINALALETPGIVLTAPIAILFSVDRATVGAVAPDPFLVANNVPYNVQDQAAKGHAAGDQYISTDVFSLGGAIAGIRILGSGSNNSSVRNNFDAGGTSFGAQPATSPSSYGAPADDVDGTSGTAAAALTVAGVETGIIYFSLRSGSGSLQFLENGGVAPSAANIYVYVAAGTPPPHTPGTTLYVSHVDLGLQAGDDIDAMVILEQDGLPGFGGTDAVVFSLAPGSPSLATLPTATEGGAAADVFVVDAGSGVRLLASASSLGLGPQAPGGQSPDNVNALDLLACSDGVGCAIAHGIQTVTVPAVSEWGLVAFVLAVMTAGTVLVRRRRAQVAYEV